MFIRPLPITPQNSKMISGHLHSLFEQYISICHKVSQSGAEWGTKNIYIYLSVPETHNYLNLRLTLCTSDSLLPRQIVLSVPETHLSEPETQMKILSGPETH